MINDQSLSLLSEIFGKYDCKLSKTIFILLSSLFINKIPFLFLLFSIPSL